MENIVIELPFTWGQVVLYVAFLGILFVVSWIFAKLEGHI